MSEAIEQAYDLDSMPIPSEEEWKKMVELIGDALGNVGIAPPKSTRESIAGRLLHHVMINMQAFEMPEDHIAQAHCSLAARGILKMGYHALMAEGSITMLIEMMANGSRGEEFFDNRN